MTSLLTLDPKESNMNSKSFLLDRAPHRSISDLSEQIQSFTQACVHVVHEARNPLTSLRLQVQLLKFQMERSSLAPSLQEVWHQLLDDMQLEIDRSCARLDDLATVAQLKNETLKLNLC